MDAAIVGHIQIRHHIDHPNLREYGGHIGYAIVPWEWGK
jgi:predicted acetyltransferase